MRLVLVEDSKAMQRVLLDRLGRVPRLTVCGVAAGEDAALELILTARPDVVLLDLSLAQGDGWNVLSRARKEGYGGLILLLTNLDLPEYRALAERRGANGYYVKSNDLDALTTRLCAEDDGQP